MRLLNLFLLTPLIAVVIASIVIGATPYQLRHSLRCSLPPTLAQLLLTGMHALERAPPFPHNTATASVYEFLCQPPSASVDELKHAFREFALRHHPDKSPQDSGATYTTVRAALDSLIGGRADYDDAVLVSVSKREAELGPKCFAIASTAALLALILHIFLQAHHAKSILASNQRAFDIVAAKKRAERAQMNSERQKQLRIREQQDAAAAVAAAAHEADVRREYSQLRQELRLPETVPDRHMMLSSMEKKIVEMKEQREREQQFRDEQKTANALRSQQQQEAAAAAAAAAAAERAAKKLKPPAPQLPAVAHGAAAPVSASDRLADRLAAARRMQEQYLLSVATATASAKADAAPAPAAAASSAASSASSVNNSAEDAAVAVLVKVLTRPQPTDYTLPLLPSATVSDVKQQLQQQHGLVPWPGMKIVYSGAVLSDAQTLTSIGYSTGKSLVVTAPPASSSSSSSSSTSAPSSASAASINAAIDAAYDASLVADSARQDH